MQLEEHYSHNISATYLIDSKFRAEESTVEVKS